jgi:NADH-quinone oxidoreductase subunit J
MVVLSSAGLFLTLAAEFMAFALIIIYAGAILVTYMFVIMLASQHDPDEDPETSPVYDRLAREPVTAVAAGFLLLALLLNVTITEPGQPNLAAQAPTDQELSENVLADRPAQAQTQQAVVGDSQASAEPGQLTNIERIGLDLFRSHPLGLELAGVILLVALIGAVVIAKTQVVGEQPTHEPEEPQAAARRDEPGN